LCGKARHGCPSTPLRAGRGAVAGGRFFGRPPRADSLRITGWRGGESADDSVLLICPNDHAAIHRCDAPLDYADLAFVFERERAAGGAAPGRGSGVGTAATPKAG
jgi:hypothetical protein